jgi:hypothetical protein
VILEIAGDDVTARRNDESALRLPSVTPLRVDDQTRVGFTSRGSTLRIEKIIYRPLVPVLDAQANAALFRDAALPSPQALDRYLRLNVIPQLGHHSWRQRDQASGLLHDLMPLSQPAVLAAMKTSTDPEVTLRLEAVSRLTDLKVEKLEHPDPDEAPAPKAPTTQPAGERAGE